MTALLFQQAFLQGTYCLALAPLGAASAGYYNGTATRILPHRPTARSLLGTH
jgi:hypothetical protein